MRIAAAGECPFTVRRALMWQRWDSLSFIHWAYPADLVQTLLPDGLAVEEQDGTAWVGLVPFHMQVTMPHVPPAPWLGRFAETNVRTYVRDAVGRSGVWFFSLDAARLAAVVTARTAYRLPYFWSAMSVAHQGDVVRYTSRRRWPARRASSSITVRVGSEIAAADVSALEHFLTARWRVFSRTREHLSYVEAEHPPWPLRRAALVDISGDLIRAAGLPTPSAEPLVHFARGIAVRLGPPRRADRPISSDVLSA